MEILEYIMKTPENTNPNILKEMLQDIQGSSDSPYLVATLQEDQGTRGSFSTGAAGEGYKLDYSYDELMQAFNNGKIVLVYSNNAVAYVASIISSNHIAFGNYQIAPDNTIIVNSVK